MTKQVNKKINIHPRVKKVTGLSLLMILTSMVLGLVLTFLVALY